MDYIVAIIYISLLSTAEDRILYHHYLTDNCEERYEEQVKQEGWLEAQSRQRIGYSCQTAPESEDWMDRYFISPSGRIFYEGQY